MRALLTRWAAGRTDSASQVRATLIVGFASVFLPISLLALLALSTLGTANRDTHELYQHRLVATLDLGQVVTSLDQMRQMVVQDVLTTGTTTSVRTQHLAIEEQLATLDLAITGTLTRYRTTATGPRHQALLHEWPAAWQAVTVARSALLHRRAATPTLQQPVLLLLTVTFNDRLNTVLDLVYALVGAEQRQGYLLDQAQQDAYGRTLALLLGGFGFITALCLAWALRLTHAVTGLYADAATRAVHDGLTGLLNHRSFLECLDAATRAVGPCALLIIDVDNFKLFNDTYGHPVGDTVLREVAALLRTSCRDGDVLARYGGDEFAVLLLAATAAEAAAVTQRLRAAAEIHPYVTPDGTRIPLMLSIGTACCPADGRTRQELVVTADAAMYAAKRGTHASASLAAQGTGALHVLRPHAAADLLGDSPFGVLEGLVSAVDAKDRYTYEHSEDVTRWALLLAEALELPAEQRRVLAVAGPLHDVGKIAVPDRILRKPGKLTKEEYESIKWHVSYGVALIRGVLQDAAVVEAVAYHHERWDGRGYPHGLTGPRTPLVGRIMQMADAVSAMTLDRPYRQGLPWNQVMRVLRAKAGTQFDPTLVEPFIAAVSQRHERAAS